MFNWKLVFIHGFSFLSLSLSFFLSFSLFLLPPICVRITNFPRLELSRFLSKHSLLYRRLGPRIAIIRAVTRAPWIVWLSSIKLLSEITVWWFGCAYLREWNNKPILSLKEKPADGRKLIKMRRKREREGERESKSRGGTIHPQPTCGFKRIYRRNKLINYPSIETTIDFTRGS